MRKITPLYQGNTRFCSIYAILNCLMVQFSTAQDKDIKISPWRAIISVFRYKQWPFLVNRSFSPHEVIAAFKIYGVKIGDVRWYPTKLVEIPIEGVDASIRAGIPLIATLNGRHELCVTDKFKLWNSDPAYSIIDSSSRITPYRVLKNPQLTLFYQIV